VAIDLVIELLIDLKNLPHEVLPRTLDIAIEAMKTYSQFGGSRRLHYFDSFHVATAKLNELPLVTSDRHLLENSTKFGIVSLDLRKI
jgi:predicted nucleic acid-binding protein